MIPPENHFKWFQKSGGRPSVDGFRAVQEDARDELLKQIDAMRAEFAKERETYKLISNANKVVIRINGELKAELAAVRKAWGMVKDINMIAGQTYRERRLIATLGGEEEDKDDGRPV